MIEFVDETSVVARLAWEDSAAPAILACFGPKENSVTKRDPAHEPSEKTRREMAAAQNRKDAADRTAFLVRSMASVLVGVILAGLASWALLRRLLLISVAVAAILLAPGCQNAQQAEDAAYRALVAVDDGLEWAAGHEPAIKAAITQAMTAAPDNATLQSAGAKALKAVDNGDIDFARAFVRSGRVVLSPAPTPPTTPPSGQ